MQAARRWSLAVLLMAGQACSDADDGSDLDHDQDSVVDGGKTSQDAGAQPDAEPEPTATETDASLLDAGSARSDAGTRDSGAPRADAQVPRDAAQAGDATVPMGPSSGCGKMVSDAAGDFTQHMLRVGNTDRIYQLYLPEGYQATRRYPVVFRFHGSSGNGLSGGLDIQEVAAKDLIVVSPDGLNTSWSTGAADVALFDALVSAVGEQYCVDLGRMFAFGFSAGAGFTELLSCIRGNTLRGVAAVEGYDWGRGRTCEGQVAAWLLHDSSDTAAPLAGGTAARDRILQQNGCTMATEPAGESCVRYLGCAVGQPVVWCQTEERGHDIRGDYAPEEAWKFFNALPTP